MEFKLLVECCRVAYGGGSRAGPDLYPSPSWAKLLHLARRHRVLGLVWRAFKELQPPAEPSVAAELKADAAAITAQNLTIAAECLRLRRAFAQADIPLLFLKGLTVGKLAYGDPFVKMGWDIDILVSPDDVMKSADRLRSLGYDCSIPPSAETTAIQRWHRRHKESVWFNSERNVHVELHSRLADNPRLISGVGLSSGSEPRMIEVTEAISLPTLPQDELFAYLCVHGASSAWFRLKWINDLAGLVHRCSPQEISRLYQSARQLGAGRAVDQALLLMHWLYDLPLEAELLQRLAGDPVSRWLASAAFAQLSSVRAEREPTQRFLGTAMIHLTQFGLMPGWTFKLSEAARQLRLA